MESTNKHFFSLHLETHKSSYRKIHLKIVWDWLHLQLSGGSKKKKKKKERKERKKEHHAAGWQQKQKHKSNKCKITRMSEGTIFISSRNPLGKPKFPTVHSPLPHPHLHSPSVTQAGEEQGPDCQGSERHIRGTRREYEAAAWDMRAWCVTICARFPTLCIPLWLTVKYHHALSN